MKNLIVFLLAMFILNGCEGKYTLEYAGTFIPDSNKTKYTEYVQKVVSAASYHMSAGRYEDPSVLVRQAQNSADDLFGVVYFKMYRSGFNRRYIDLEEMTSEESKIFDSLLNIRSKNFNRAIQ
ncbi:MAG TPA: hypothetical protein PLH46_06465 [Caldisericia bacterium]|nr:hypothetical protein [Caldisericia bacterium]